MRKVLSSNSSVPNSPSEWSVDHYIVDRIQPFKGTRKAPPVFTERDPLPVLSELSCHVFVLSHAVWPVIVQALCTYLLPGSLWIDRATVALYVVAHYTMMLRQATILHQIGKRVGYLDGHSHKRDSIPFHDARKVLFTVTFFATTRPCLAFLVAYWYDAKTSPVISWTFPLKLLLYPLILDLWFYLYHRACHEIGFLWRYHRTHHLTKHPIPILASYSDFEQETIEAVIVPLLTYLSMKYVINQPLSFQEWWICQAYILFGEVMGHSGIRLYGVVPTLASPLLRMFQCELVIEDHDLHHRNGWRRSFNYGKQTRLWDSLLRTVAPRIETRSPVLQGTVRMRSF